MNQRWALLSVVFLASIAISLCTFPGCDGIVTDIKVGKPTFNPNGGTFADSVDVAISSSIDGAQIRYTTDGSTPSSSHGTLFTYSIHLTDTTTLRAVAYKSDMNDSDVVSATFQILSVIPIDVVSIEPSSAPPGTIVNVGISSSESVRSIENKDQIFVMFDQVPARPLNIEDDHLTVMAPIVEPGTYTLRVMREETTGTGRDLIVDALPPVAGNIAKDFINDIQTVVSSTNTWSKDIEGLMPLSPSDLTNIQAGFSNLHDLLQALSGELDNLDPQTLEVLNQLLFTSGVGERVNTLAARFRQPMQSRPVTAFHAMLAQPSAVTAKTVAFQALARLDAASAVMADASAVITGVIYGGIATCIIPPHVGCAVLPAIPILANVRFVLDTANSFIKGVVPTDLKEVYIRVSPDEGNILNPGETATVGFYGHFGTQSTITREIVDTALRTILRWVKLPEGDSTELDQALNALADEALGIAESALGETGNVIFDLDEGMSVPWIRDVPLDMTYYSLNPGTRFTTTLLTLGLPLADILNTAIVTLLGGPVDTLFTNNPVTIDDSSIASYDFNARRVTAHGVGQTMLRVRPYYFDEVLTIPFVAVIEGWKYLEESETIIVQNTNDPVDSDLDQAPISGVVPGLFSMDGGEFEISVSPIDPNGDLISAGVTVGNFSLSPIQVTLLSDPSNVVTTGIATPQTIEVIPPTDPKAGVNVVIVMDSSGSMGRNDRNRDRVTAAKALVATLDQNDAAAVMDFGAGSDSGFNVSRLLQDFTSDHTLLEEAIERVVAKGTTPLYESLLDAIGHIVAKNVSNPAIVVLTDGQANTNTNFDNVVDKANANGIPIFPIGLGTSVDFTQLQALANQTGGTFASALESDQLQTLFENLGTAVRAGRIVVHASGVFLPPLTQMGSYALTGVMTTHIDGRAIDSPFSFQFDAVTPQSLSRFGNPAAKGTTYRP